MSIIFQLFRADDLKMLSDTKLDELKEMVIAALKEAQQELQSHAGSRAESLRPKETPEPLRPPEPLRLNLSHKPDPSHYTPPQINNTLKIALAKRFHEVSQQLKSTQTQSASNFNALLSQHLGQPDPEEQAKEKKILEWALSCEVNNFEFYYPIWRARKTAHDFFRQETGQEPKDPDSPYSPFNPSHPFFNFFYGLS